MSASRSDSSTFSFSPATFVPYRDTAEVARVRQLSGKDLLVHPNPDFKIQLVPDAEVEALWINDFCRRLRQSSETGEQLVVITPNPWPTYAKVAEWINQNRISCQHLHTFNMDEYANEDGVIAPESWPLGFNHAFKHFFYNRIDADLRPPAKQVHGLTNENLDDYGKMLEDLGGADICYSGPGWTGHLAFIEPDAPEFKAGSLEEWKQMGPRMVTLSPFTIAQNSLHGSMGASGDLTAVPPRAATIGPAQVLAARERIAFHTVTIGNSFQSWQRMISRLVLHGPVTPLVPESILQTVPSTIWLSETIAAPIETRWDLGY